MPCQSLSSEWLVSCSHHDASHVYTAVLSVKGRPKQEASNQYVLGKLSVKLPLHDCSLEYNPQAGPTKFMIGTEQGNIMTCNRKAKNPQDRVGASFPGVHLPAFLHAASHHSHTRCHNSHTPVLHIMLCCAEIDLSAIHCLSSSLFGRCASWFIATHCCAVSHCRDHTAV